MVILRWDVLIPILKSTEVDFVHFIAANLFAEAPFSMSGSLAISIPQIPTPDRRSVARKRPLPVILYDRRVTPLPQAWRRGGGMRGI